MLMVRSFSFALFLAYALLMLTFSHDENQSNIYSVNVYRKIANALKIFSLKFPLIYSSYLTLLVRLVESLLFIRFYCISDDG